MAELGITITKHLLDAQKTCNASGEFTGLLNEIATAAKIISREVNMAGLANSLGATGSVNVQGEEVQKLDEFANDTIIKVLDHTGFFAAMASEESEDIIEISDKHLQGGKYTIAFDPLDGSSNIDVNTSIGTIFSIHKKIGESGKSTADDLLQKGSKQVAAGYIIYGSSTMFVYSTGQGVHGFTLDPSIGEFFLSHSDIKIPSKGKTYSCNEGNYRYWSENIKRYVDYLKEEDKETDRPYGSRYIGSLVADFHRNLLKGGIFFYPADNKSEKTKEGKLRLLYEANPLAFIVEQAGGYASDSTISILDIKPEHLHQRVPLFIGSKEDVKMAEKFIQGEI